jgi:hypothetical protein
MPDFSVQPDISTQVVQPGNTLPDPYQAQVYQNPGLAQAFQNYVQSVTGSISRGAESQSDLFGSALKSVSDVIGAHQEQRALEQLARMQNTAGYTPEPLPVGAQSFPNSNISRSVGAASSPVQNLDDFGNAPSPLTLDKLIPVLSQIKTPGLATNILNGAQHMIAKRDELEAKKEALKAKEAEALASNRTLLQNLGANPDLATSKAMTTADVSRVQKQTERAATLEKATSLGKSFSGELASAVGIDAKQAIIAKYSGEPGLKNALAVASKLVNQDLAQEAQGTRQQVADQAAPLRQAQTDYANTRNQLAPIEQQRKNNATDFQTHPVYVDPTTGQPVSGGSLGLPPAPPSIPGLPNPGVLPPPPGLRILGKGGLPPAPPSISGLRGPGQNLKLVPYNATPAAQQLKAKAAEAKTKAAAAKADKANTQIVKAADGTYTAIDKRTGLDREGNLVKAAVKGEKKSALEVLLQNRKGGTPAAPVTPQKQEVPPKVEIKAGSTIGRFKIIEVK